MYTLLGFCWLLSFVCLADGIGGRPRLFIIWGVVNAGAIWVQYAALPMVAVSWVLAVTLWGFLRQDGSGRRSGTVWLWTGLGISVAAAAPALALSLRFIEAGGGGTWLPTPQDLLALFALVTSGLSSARGHFLDSAHLTIPALAGLPDLAWAAAGLLPASLAVHGLASAWQKGGRDRADALLATALVLGPVAGTYGLAVVSGASIWAQKAFLGAAYLIYLWAGVGLSRAPWRAARYAMAVAALAISLASLIPYYTVWQKTDTRIAFGTIPAGSPQPAILLDRAYMGPVAFYYLGAGAEVWGINGTSKGAILVRLTPNGVLPQSYVPVECDAGQFHAAPTVYLYPTAVGRALDERQTWPACVRTKPTVLFREGKWTPLDR